MSRLGVAVRIVIVVVVASVVSLRSVPDARAQDSGSADTASVEVDGSGSFDVNALMSVWSSAMFESSKPTNLSYIANGDRDGRTQLALGQVDFAISGMPLTADDLQRLAARNVQVIQAPLAVSAMAFLYSEPNNLGIEYFKPDDPNDPAGDGSIDGHFTGDIKMTNAVLGKTMSGVSGYRLFYDPEFTNLLDAPAGDVVVPPVSAQIAVPRSDPGASDYYLEQFLTQFAPDSYNAHLTSQLLPQNVVSENWPLLDMPGRSGPDSVSDLLSSWSCPCGQGLAVGGAIGPVDPTTAADALAAQDLRRTDPADHPGTPVPLHVVEVQNGAGEWVKPTPDAITTAAAAGGGAPLYGLTQNVPGAYPFTWTTSLFAPSSGLSVDKTNALATFVRYASGPGQALAPSVLEGQLPATLRTQAAEKADEIVKGNCAAAGGTTKVDPTGGPYWPTGVAVPAGGTLICVGPASPPTTSPSAASGTVAPAVSSTGLTTGFGATAFAPASSGSPQVAPSGPLAPLASSESQTGDTSATGDAAAATTPSPASAATPTTVRAAPAAATLPLRAPDDGRFALDRFTTVLLGALAFVVVRSLVRPRLVRLA